MVDHLKLYTTKPLPEPAEQPIGMLSEQELSQLSVEELLAYAIQANKDWLTMYEAAVAFHNSTCRFEAGYNDIIRRMDAILMEEAEELHRKMFEAMDLIENYRTGWLDRVYE